MHYILSQKQVARRKEKSLHGKHKWEEIVVLEGSLWHTRDAAAGAEPEEGAPPGPGAGPGFRQPQQHHIHSHTAQLTLYSEEHNGAVLQCEHSDVRPLTSDQYSLLLALSVCSERLKVFSDAAWMKEASEMVAGSTVYVLNKYSISQEKMVGKVRYKGLLSGAQGIWFGVELSASHKGKGHTDGVHKNQQLFQCAVDCGMFVAINRLRKSHDSVVFKPHSPLPEAPVSIGERVVWISDKGPESGGVRWVGVLHDCKTGELTIGVEFDNPVGTGTGKYRDRQLFRAKQGHASLVPLIGLMKENEFYAGSPTIHGGSASGGPEPPKLVTPGAATTRHHATLPPARPDPTRRAQIELSIYDRQPVYATANITDTYRPTSDALVASDYSNVTAKVKPQRPDDVATTAVTRTLESDEEDGYTELLRKPAYYTAPMAATSRAAVASRTAPVSRSQNGQQNGDYIVPRSLSAAEADTDLELNSTVEVCGNPEYCRYGIIRWIGYIRDKTKPIAGLEMEEESAACTDGTFGRTRLFTCPPKKGFFVHLKKLRRDGRFEETGHDLNRRESLAFGSIDCPEVAGFVGPPTDITELVAYIGKNKGIQGHHNSCYLDAMLFSMFAFSMAFDPLLHRPRRRGDIEQYEHVQSVLRDCIVNPLRRNFFVRADKVLKLRRLLDELGSVEGLTSEEKDPEEFLSSLLEQIMKADPFIQLNSGQESYFYQLFVEKDEDIVLPTTQQLLALSFLQSNIKLAEVPSCLILQMPRFGKDYRMYKRIMPSLFLDITDILDTGPRQCTSCGRLAEFECKECYQNHSSGLDQIAYCSDCLTNSHPVAGANHKPQRLKVNREYVEFVEKHKGTHEDVPIRRQLMELFAVVCIETSHYVSFVKCGTGEEAPWVFFDSMADRQGGQNGYNMPEVTPSPLLAEWLQRTDHANILACSHDKQLPEHMRRVLCDAYICMYQSQEVMMYS